MKPDERSAVVGYIFAGIIVAIIASRLILRKIRRQAWNLSDFFCQASGLIILALIPVVTLEIRWGSVNSSPPGIEDELTAEEVRRRIIGSKLTLLSRSLYATFLWLQKCSILSLKERIIDALPSALSYYLIWATWVMLAATFVAVQVTIFSGCRPFHEYWTILTPQSYSHCGYARDQLYVLVCLNLFADMVLLCLPMPWLFRVDRTIGEKMTIVALFVAHLVMIPVAILRLPFAPERTLQHRRLTMSYIEGFLECLIANGSIIYSLCRTNRFSTGFTNISQVSTIGVDYDRPSYEVPPDEAAQKGFPNLNNKIMRVGKFNAELEERFGRHSIHQRSLSEP